MKQVFQDLKTGVTSIVETPLPQSSPGVLLIRTTTSLISAGTERMLLDFGKASFFNKVRQQPEKARLVLEKIRTDGLMPTLSAVRSKLEQPLPLGYCNVGIVIDVGSAVQEFKRTDRVVSNGPHADIVRVPKNLCAKIPDSVDDESAAFAVIASIGLQGIRLVQPALGESVVVIGAGLIGLLTIQLLRAHGCRVLAIDLDDSRLAMAQRFGADIVNPGRTGDPSDAGMAFSRGRGVDAVIIAASTSSSNPIAQAARMCRKRGRIVLVGTTGLQLSRADFYEKELSFQVSCSYGPGRHDRNYEEKGNDYPYGLVRWTAQRNFEAVLDMMASGALDVKPLISHRFAIQDARRAYEVVGGSEPSLGILLEYPGVEVATASHTIGLTPRRRPGVLHKTEKASASVSFIGSGNYATAVLIPAFRAAGARLRSVASSSGASGVHVGRKFGFEEATTDTGRLFVDRETDALVVATRHDTHARFVLEALDAGKHVFVEKPLCLTLEELAQIQNKYTALVDRGSALPLLMVGFNRRFAPQVQKTKSLLSVVPGSKSFIVTVNAGAIPESHWTQDKAVGGGRIIGEACHFIDLLRFLAGTAILGGNVVSMNSVSKDTVTISLKFADGSIGTIHYFANGSRSFPKERLEIFAGGRVLQLDNFRKLRGYGWSDFRDMNLWQQDKGQSACVKAFVEAIQTNNEAPIPFEEIVEVSRLSIELAADAGA